MNFDDWILLDAEAIPYGELDDQLLKRLVLEQADPFIATYALGELSMRSSELCRETAYTILQQRTADHFLLGQAFCVLYDSDKDAALRFIPGLIADGDAVVLSDVLGRICMDLETFRSNAALTSLAMNLAECLKHTDLSRFFDPDDLDRFLSAFPLGDSRDDKRGRP